MFLHFVKYNLKINYDADKDIQYKEEANIFSKTTAESIPEAY